MEISTRITAKLQCVTHSNTLIIYLVEYTTGISKRNLTEHVRKQDFSYLPKALRKTNLTSFSDIIMSNTFKSHLTMTTLLILI